jgi:copper chaperone
MYKQRMAFKMILFAVILTAISCSGNTNKSSEAGRKAASSLIEVSIGGMSCTDCEQTIQKRVGELAGIQSIKASYVTGSAVIEFSPDKVDTAKIRQAITGSGYSVKKFLVPAN